MQTLLDRVFPQKASVSKAVTGDRASWYYPMLDQGEYGARDANKAMREAQAVYHTHPWVNAAERIIGDRFSTVTWHLEDDQGEEVTDKSPEAYQIVQRLIERPYTPKPGDPVSQTPRTRSALWKIISRHMGLCNVAPLFLDQLDATAQTPLQMLYINPARLYPACDSKGNLTGWVLDKDDRGGGMPLELEEVLLIVLDPPDTGWFGTGLVEAASTKIELTRLADRQASGALSTGGRLPGVFAPKGDATLSDEQFEQLKRDVRTVNESVDAAKRSLVLRGPVEFTRTSATSSELNLVEIAKMGKEDIYGLWGVPMTQSGFALPAGLNSGGAKDVDFEVLWQNAVGPRVRTFREAFQFELLDRFKLLGISPELVIDEPEFDDDAPLYEKAERAQGQPLKQIERRELLGLEPFGDDRDEEVWVDGTRIYPAEEPKPVPAQLVPFSPPEPPPLEPPQKASLRDDTAMRADVNRVLRAFAKMAASRAVEKHGHLTAKPNEVQAIFDAERFEAELEEVLRPYVGRIAAATVERVQTTGKAGLESVLAKLLKSVGLRVKGITETTRETLAGTVRKGIEEGLSPAQLGNLIQASSAFDEYRAELIARTETGTLLNQAALSSYQGMGVERVQVYDGDKDDICAAADGAIWTLDEAERSPLGHPNCTRDFAPVVGAA